jgi:hypothetical protein
MNLLGSVGQLYMFVLLVLLFLGSGFAIWRFINFLMERRANKQGQGIKQKQNGIKMENVVNNELKKGKGGLIMANNGWVKLAVFSLVGIIVSVAILGFVSTNSNMQGMNMSTTQNSNIHQQHLQSGSNNAMQGNMNMNSQMGNMQAQGSMNMNGNMNQSQIVQQQLNQLQMQINQIQQQLGSMNGNMNMNGNSQMQQNSTGSMSGSGNMGGMGMMSGMMGMGNMQQSGNMNNMQQNNNMNNMQQSSSSMGMM